MDAVTRMEKIPLCGDSTGPCPLWGHCTALKGRDRGGEGGRGERKGELKEEEKEVGDVMKRDHEFDAVRRKERRRCGQAEEMATRDQ